MAATIQKIETPKRWRAQDTSGNNNHGQIYSGRGLEFDGVTDYLSVSSSRANVAFGSFLKTFACWAKFDDASDEQIIGAACLSLQSVGVKDGKIATSTVDSDDDIGGTTVLQDNTWYRLVWVINVDVTDAAAVDAAYADGFSNADFYINGVKETKEAANFFRGSTEMLIGARKTGSDYNINFAGKMSDVQLWDIAWTAEDAAFDYANPEQLALNRGGTSLTESNLKLWYPMNDGHRGQQSYVLDASNTGLGDDLVTNGDFSDATNADSSSALTGWDVSGGTHDADNKFTISNGECTCISDGADTHIKQEILTTGVTYSYSIEITSVTSGALKLQSESTAFVSNINSVGTHTGYFTATDPTFKVVRNGACNITFDNVVIKPVNNKNHATTVFYGDELLANTGFETDVSNWSSSGSLSSGPTHNTSHAKVGAESLSFVASAAEGGVKSAKYTTVTGRRYKVDFWAKPLNSETKIRHVIMEGDGSGWINAGDFTLSSYSTATGTVGSGNWYNLTYEYTEASGGTDAEIRILSASDDSDGTFAIDEVSIKEMGTATGWTDADQQLDIPQTALQSYNQLAWFEQSDETVIIADTTNDNDNIFDGGGSISAWIYPIDLGENAYGRIIDKSSGTGGEDGYHLALYSESGSTSNIQFGRGHDNTDGYWTFDARYITYGEWQHIVVVYDDDAVGNNPILYLNGESKTITEATTPVGNEETDASQALTIGNRTGATDRTFAGAITEVSMWNKELSQAEVNELYNDGKALDASIHSASPSTGTDYLKGYWRNNGLATWQDLTANNNDGTPIDRKILMH